jgi:uncharacterized membrane protein HdeD (DUF308 family)
MDLPRSASPPLADDVTTDPLVVGTRAARTMLAVRAVLAVGFGLVALFWPQITVLALAIAFGLYALLEGVSSVVDAVRNRTRTRWWLGLLGGLVSIAAGVVALIWPGITAIALAIVVGAWAVVTGIAEVAGAWRLRRAGGGAWLLALAGLLSVIAGIVILLRPGAGAIGLALVLGAFAVVYGVVLGALAVSLRSPAP